MQGWEWEDREVRTGPVGAFPTSPLDRDVGTRIDIVLGLDIRFAVESNAIAVKCCD